VDSIHTLTDLLSVEHHSDQFRLIVTLPTRDGSRKPFREPQPGTPLPFSHHLAFFHARRPERLLRADGTDEDIYFTPATVLETNVGGGRKDNMECKPLIIGKPTKSISTVSSTEKKGDQTIQCGAATETSLEWSVSSKYFHPKTLHISTRRQSKTFISCIQLQY
jgi:hypothetical protein